MCYNIKEAEAGDLGVGNAQTAVGYGEAQRKEWCMYNEGTRGWGRLRE